MELIKKFENLSKTDVAIAGGKGASLGEMTQAKIPVPGGFVILSSTFEKYLEETDLNIEIDSVLHTVNPKEIHTIENASEKIKSLIIGKNTPEYIKSEIQKFFKSLNVKFVAVRSSATAEDSSLAAWAGQLESYLNTTEENLFENVKKCWASLFTPRAIFYRFEKNLHKQKISVAVVVQKMIESEKSGIAFSVHPVTQDENQIIIEAGFGLGEAIVSGQITPDSYVIGKKPRKIIDKNIQIQTKGLYRANGGDNEWRNISTKQGQRPVLTNKEILELSEIILQIENHYNFPCDIEWAFEKGIFYITQSRPITTLSGKVNSTSLVDKFIKDKKGSEITKHEGNFSLLVWGTAVSLQSSDIFNKYYSEDFGSLLLLIEGERGIGFFDFNNYKKSTEITLEKFLSTKRLQEIKDYNLLMNEIDNYYNKYSPEELEKLTNDELEEIIVKAFKFLRDWQVITLFCEALDKKIIEKYFKKYNTEKIDFNNFFEKASLQDFDSFIVNRDRCLLSFNKKDLYQTQWVLASYLSTPNLFESERIIKNTIKDLGGKNKIKKEQRNIKNEITKNKIKSDKFRKTIQGKLKKLFDFVKLSITLRDTRKEYAFKGITLLSNAVREMFFRMGLNEKDILYVRGEDFENKEYKDEKYINTIEKRKKGVVVYCTKGHIAEEYVNFDQTKKKIFNFSDTKSDSNEIRGTSACGGKAKGRVKIVLSLKDFGKFQEGNVLVTSMTRPEFVPLMKKASAVITDEGGVTCHAAIVSRELGLPCIIGTKNATRKLKDNDFIDIDADKGVARLIRNDKNSRLKLIFDRDRMYLYPWVLAEQCLTDDIEKIFGKKIDKTLLEFRNSHLYSYLNISQFNEIGEFLFNKVRKDRKFYKIIEKNILSTGKDLMSFCDKINRLNYSELSNRKLSEIYNSYSKKIKTMRMWGWVPPLIDGIEISFLSDYLQERLRQFMKSIRKEDRTAEYYSILSSSEKMSEIQIEEIARLKLIQKINTIDPNLIKLLKTDDKKAQARIKDNQKVFNAIKKHAKKFNWLTYAYVGPTMSEADTLRLIEDSLKQKNSIEKQISDIKNHHIKLGYKKREILEKIKLTSELKYLFKMSSFFMHLKDLRKGIYQKSYVAMDSVLTEIAKRLNLTLKEVKYLTEEEVNNSLNKGKKISKIAKERTKYCVSITKNGKTEVYTGNKAKEIINKETTTELIDETAREFKGLIAYSGKVRGIAKIVSVVKDIPKIKNGEILVSPSTNPDLILAMKKASAFVTDMGGITSHAAIVSREMKKPCIVGTKIATKIISDGDLIEVDANNGIIKILEKKK